MVYPPFSALSSLPTRDPNLYQAPPRQAPPRLHAQPSHRASLAALLDDWAHIQGQGEG